MTRRCVTAAAVSLLCLTGGAQADFSRLITDFENPAWTPFITEVMFRNPSVSGSTTGLDPAITNMTFLTDITQGDTFSVVHSGNRASAVTWGWANPGYHTSWVRLITLNAQQLPNPALHLGGKVRMWVAVKAYTNANYTTPVTNGYLYVGLGVRETGAGVGLGGNGGVSGDVEWVGLDRRLVEIFAGANGICNTTADPNSDDIQVTPNGSPAGPDTVCVSAGPDGILQTSPGGDDTIRVTPIGMYRIRSNGVMQELVFDFPTLQATGKVFPFAGDGQLLATPNNRGTLDHLVLTNDPNNAGVNAKVFLVNIDDITFEAPVIDPPAIVAEPYPPPPLAEHVPVRAIDPNAALVEVYRLQTDGSPVLLGSVAPQHQTEVNVPVTPLAANIRIVARQTVGTDVSDDSTPVIVAPPGNAPLRIAMAVRETDAYDHDLGCAADGTGFNPNQPSVIEFIGASGYDAFGVPNCPRYVPQLEWFELRFNPCDPVYGVYAFSGNGVLNLNPPPDHTNGVWEGLYFRIDAFSPSKGPFTVYLDDMAVKDAAGNVCFVDDFESYPADAWYIVADCTGNGVADTYADPNSDDVQVVWPGSTTFCGQIVVAPGPDGILSTTPAGDDGISPMHARFNLPTVAGTNVGVANSPDLAIVTAEEAYSGNQSLKVQWAFIDASNLRSTLRLTTNGSTATNPPETLVNPDPVVPLSLDGTLCDGSGDLYYSVMIKLAPPQIPGDCDRDADVDLHDYACFQQCFSVYPVPSTCGVFDIAPNGAPDGFVNYADFALWSYLYIGPTP